MTKKKTEQLTLLQESFVYVLFKNPAISQRQAYIQAGYKARGKTAEQAACRLASNVKIQTAIQDLREGAAKRAEISVAKAVKEYGIVGFTDIADYYEDDELKPLEDIDPIKRRAIESIKVTTTTTGKADNTYTTTKKELKLCSKLSALDSIMKHLGGFEKHQQAGASKAVMIVNFADIDVNG